MDDSINMDVEDQSTNEINNPSFSSRYSSNRVCFIDLSTSRLMINLFNRKVIDVYQLHVHLVVILSLQVIQEKD